MERLARFLGTCAISVTLLFPQICFGTHEKVDFNGDGYGDIVVGVPGEDLGSVKDAGAINVIYGSAKGPTSKGNQFWNLNASGVQGDAAAGDRLGDALTVGDFNGDGRADLAIGVPMRDSSGGLADTGAILVLYGSTSGLKSAGNQLLDRGADGGAGDRLGTCLAAGDFDGDGHVDLAASAPFDDVNGKADAGSVWIIRGSGAGLTTANNQLLWQGLGGIKGSLKAGDRFGSALAVGNFGRGSQQDLAIGAPGEDVGSAADAGGVNIVYGSSGGLSSAGNQFWTQNSSKVPDKAEAGDQFGYAIAAGDFNGNGYDDLAIGAPFEDRETGAGSGSSALASDFGGVIANAGWGCVLNGNIGGLQGNGTIELNFRPGPDDAPDNAQFGTALAAGDVNGDTIPDLAIGAPLATVDIFDGAGAVNVLIGRISGLSGDDLILIGPDNLDLPPTISFEGMNFGAALAIVDTKDLFARQLLVGCPRLEAGGKPNAGRAYMFDYDADVEALFVKSLEILQGGNGIKDRSEKSDGFSSRFWVFAASAGGKR